MEVWEIIKDGYHWAGDILTQFGQMNFVYTITIWQHVGAIHVMLFSFHGYNWVRIFYHYHIRPELPVYFERITPDMDIHEDHQQLKGRLMICAEYFFMLFSIPFLYWFDFLYGQFWYTSHVIFIISHLSFFSQLAAVYVYRKELCLENGSHVFVFFVWLVFTASIAICTILYMCVNGFDDGYWFGWGPEDIYRYSDLPEHSIQYWLHPVDYSMFDARRVPSWWKPGMPTYP